MMIEIGNSFSQQNDLTFHHDVRWWALGEAAEGVEVGDEAVGDGVVVEQ